MSGNRTPEENWQTESAPDPFASGEVIVETRADLPSGQLSKNSRILLVEDFACMRRIIRNLLADIGFQNVVEAESGGAALDCLHNERIDMVITDLKIPDISGIELLRAVRADPRLAQTPVLIMTADAQRETILEAARAGVNAYLIKPFSAAILESKIRQISGTC